MDDETFAWCLFQEADTDESGALDRDEVRALARNLGYPMDDAALDKAMEVMDEDKGGEVEFDEFLKWFQQAQKGPKAGWAQKLVAAAKKYMEDAMMGKADNTFAGGLRGRLNKHKDKLFVAPQHVLELSAMLPASPEPARRRIATPEPKYPSTFSPNTSGSPLFGRRSSPTRGLSVLNLTGGLRPALESYIYQVENSANEVEAAPPRALGPASAPKWAPRRRGVQAGASQALGFVAGGSNDRRVVWCRVQETTAGPRSTLDASAYSPDVDALALPRRRGPALSPTRRDGRVQRARGN